MFNGDQGWSLETVFELFFMSSRSGHFRVNLMLPNWEGDREEIPLIHQFLIYRFLEL